MKKLLISCCSFLIFACASYSPPKAADHEKVQRVYLDENEKIMSAENFGTKWRNKANGLSAWSYFEGDKRITKLSRNLYQRGHLNHSKVLEELQRLTEKDFDSNAIFLIEYTFLNDLCTSDHSNKWSKPRIRQRKGWSNIQKRKMKKENEDVVYLRFFEEGIHLENNPENPKEYFFLDQENYLRNLIFRDRTLCGSFAILKPNGELLIRNGEYRPDEMFNHLKPEIWEPFFNPVE